MASMRRALRNPVIRDTIVWLAILPMSIFYVAPQLIERFSSKPGVINIDGIGITAAEFQIEITRQQRKIAALYHKYGESAKYIIQMAGLSENPTELAYQIIVRQTLLDSVAKKYNLMIDNDLLNREIVRILPEGAILPDGQLNIPLEVLEEVRDSLSNELLEKMVLDFVDASAYVPNFEVKSNFIQQYSKRDYSVLTFAFDHYLNASKAKPVTDKALATYFNENKSKYYVEEKRDGKVYYFDPNTYGIELKEEEIKNYYNRNKPNFKDKPAEIQIARILISDEGKAGDLQKQLVANPDKFKELAIANSEDTDSAAKGGVLDYFARGVKDPEFEQIAFALNKENPISEVIKTKDGYEIIKFLNKKQATFKELKAVEGEIKSALRKERFKKLFPINVRKIMHSSDKKSEIAKMLKKGQQGITFVDMPAGTSKDIKKLFSLKTEGDFDFFIEGDRGVIVILEKISKGHTPDIKEVRSKVEADYYHSEALAKLTADVNKAQKEADTKSFEAIKEEFKSATIRNIKEISPQDKAVLTTLSNQGIPVSKVMGLQLKDIVLKEVTDKGGFLIKMTNMAPVDLDSFEAKKDEIKQNLSRERRLMIAESFIASLKKDAKISISDDRLKNQLKGLL